MTPEEFQGRVPTLETPRLLLRRLTLHDAHDIYEYSRDPLVAQHVLWEAHRSVSESRAYIRYMMRKYRQDDAYSWGIELKSEQKIIGTIGFMWIQPENNSAEVGYSLSRGYWNQGIMTEALGRILDYGFRSLSLNRIEAQYETDNPASGAVMRKCGMQREGLLRSRLMNKGHYADMVLCAILRREYMHPRP